MEEFREKEGVRQRLGCCLQLGIYDLAEGERG